MFKNRQITTTVALAAVVAFSLLAAGCASIEPTNLDLGTLTEGRFYDRKIVVRADTKYVNVDDGEVIKFVIQEPGSADTSFTWHFDTPRQTVGDLSKLAPSGVLSRPVKVYVTFFRPS